MVGGLAAGKIVPDYGEYCEDSVVKVEIMAEAGSRINWLSVDNSEINPASSTYHAMDLRMNTDHFVSAVIQSAVRSFKNKVYLKRRQF